MSRCCGSGCCLPLAVFLVPLNCMLIVKERKYILYVIWDISQCWDNPCSCMTCMHDMQDEAIGGQLEPEMGGAAALPTPQPPPPRTYADKISMSELDHISQSAFARPRLVCTGLCCMFALQPATYLLHQLSINAVLISISSNACCYTRFLSHVRCIDRGAIICHSPLLTLSVKLLVSNMLV